MRFFQSFEADAYVISASPLAHGHPDAISILGLVLAIRKAKTLFMTSGWGIKYSKLWRLAKFLDVNLKELFDECLQIPYLKQGDFYMTLSGMTNLPGQERDLRESTDLYNIASATDTYNVRKDTDQQMEFGYNLGPVRDFADLETTNMYNITNTTQTASGHQFFLDIVEGIPVITTEKVNVMIETKWHHHDGTQFET